MTRFLHQLSGICFYLLGSTFFIAYLLFRNAIAAPQSLYWLQVADLPLALSAVIYAGLSVYISVSSPNRSSRMLAFAIGLPLAVFFFVLVVMNFWVA